MDRRSFLTCALAAAVAPAIPLPAALEGADGTTVLADMAEARTALSFDNTSIWFVNWGSRVINIYPRIDQ